MQFRSAAMILVPIRDRRCLFCLLMKPIGNILKANRTGCSLRYRPSAYFWLVRADCSVARIHRVMENVAL